MHYKTDDDLSQLCSIAFIKGLPSNAVEIPLPEGLTLIEADFKEQKIWMESKAWKHDKFRLIRFTRLFSENRISTFNWVIYPQDCYDAPIFASDFVVTANKLRIAVIDAMPIFPSDPAYQQKWVTPFKGLHKKSLKIAPQFERKLSWSTQYLGENACLATGITTDNITPMIQLWESYMNRYWELTATMQKVTASVEAQITNWHKSYNYEHRKVEDKRNPYMLYFGEELGKRYNSEFLFSDILGR